jgi:putative addiction module CopG family antidote
MMVQTEARMTITLSTETRKLLEEKLKSGGYTSADDVVHAALQALNELESGSLDDETLDALDRAEDDIDHGAVHEWRDVREQVRSKFLEP